ncbi:hypothetical protein [Aquirufa ecclesiirivi]|uniref:hypothetical protein n=1 Tax=Aquirufa ecclesiirivi TaxID=2715124 RepID=UPI0023D85478|nr:hypothetical protein [Aquirufa ecclesiirivi]MDF0693211.1 hypothetical protein [Aquirufa ecclesiirivi]
MNLFSQRHFYFLLSLAPAIFFYFFLLKFGINAPFADDWSAINGFIIRFFHGNDNLTEKIALLASQCNEHREGYLSIVSLIQYAISGQINYMTLNLIGAGATLGVHVLLNGYLHRYQLPHWWVIPLAFIWYNAAYFHNIFWPVCALQHNSIVFFILSVFYVLDGKGKQSTQFIWAIFLAFIAVFTSGNGFLLFVAAFPILKNYRWTYWIIWSVAGVAFFSLYMLGYQHPFQRGHLTDNLHMVGSIVHIFFVYLGSFVGVFFSTSSEFRVELSLGIGMAVFGAWMIFVFKHIYQIIRRKSSLDVLMAIQLFILATACIYAVGRANLPIEFVFESRYAINSTLFLMSLCLMLWHAFPSIKTWRAWGFVAFSILYFTLSYWNNLLAVINFTSAQSAAIIKHSMQHREHYYFKDSLGQKADLGAPTLKKLAQLGGPIVDFTAELPSSVKYANDVVSLTFKNGFYTLDQHEAKLEKDFQTDVASIPKAPHGKDLLKFSLEKNGLRYSGEKTRARMSHGSDGMYVVFENAKKENWVFSLYFEELDRARQIKFHDAIYVRKVSGITPFIYLPDGDYRVKIMRVEDNQTRLVGVLAHIPVKGM